MITETYHGSPGRRSTLPMTDKIASYVDAIRFLHTGSGCAAPLYYRRTIPWDRHRPGNCPPTRCRPIMPTTATRSTCVHASSRVLTAAGARTRSRIMAAQAATPEGASSAPGSTRNERVATAEER